MESNMIAPLKWEWKNQVTLSTSTTDVSQKLRSPEWDVEEDSGIDSGYLSSSVVAGPGPGQVSLCKSSNSASTNSSSVGEVKSAKFKLKGFEGLGDGLISKIEKGNRTVSSPTLETSVGSAEPVLSLKLSKQTYLKEVWPETNAMVASHPVIPTERFKMKCQTNHAPRCQVEGCNLDLSSSKDYHRKHRVCESHSRSPKVLVAGVERRFCQQCSRFHGLVEFDEKKRSCRKRLAEHNARRRKPQTEVVHCSSMRSSESHGADGKRELSFVWNQMPFAHMKRNETLSWEGLVSSKAMQIRSYSSTKVEKIEGQLLMPGNQQLGSMSMHGHRSHGFSISKADSNTSEFFNQGMDESSVPSNIGAAQDIQRALSLLSADVWSSCEVKHGSMNYSTPALYPGMSEPLMQMGSHGFPLAESSAWQSREPLSATLDSPISTIPFKDSSC